MCHLIHHIRKDIMNPNVAIKIYPNFKCKKSKKGVSKTKFFDVLCHLSLLLSLSNILRQCKLMKIQVKSELFFSDKSGTLKGTILRNQRRRWRPYERRGAISLSPVVSVQLLPKQFTGNTSARAHVHWAQSWADSRGARAR